jgi:hypothetical protein
MDLAAAYEEELQALAESAHLSVNELLATAPA